MSLFFKKKRTDSTSSNGAVKKNTITLICPECGFEQSESQMAISTYCRGCSAHYKIADGRAVPIKKNPSNPYASLKNHSGKPRLRSTGTPEPEAQEPESSTHPLRHAPSPVKKNASGSGFFKNKVSQRDILCYECGRHHQASSESSSSLCPACGAYISLKDYDIRDNWNRRIQTRGNVIIQKKATVTGITIHCHDLLVNGKLTGGVDCSGNFTLRSHGKIMGRVRCKRLVIEKRARVEFSNPVTCEDAIIDGTVTGNFTCTGKLHLKKKATLTGDIKVATMVIEEGARHHGRISIGQ